MDDARTMWMTKDEAAAALRCDARTVRRLVVKGYLPSYGVGRVVRFKPHEVAACLPLLSARKATAEPVGAVRDLRTRLRNNARNFYRTQPGGAA